MMTRTPIRSRATGRSSQVVGDERTDAPWTADVGE